MWTCDGTYREDNNDHKDVMLGHTYMTDVSSLEHSVTNETETIILIGEYEPILESFEASMV